MQHQSEERGVRLEFIQPGKPTQECLCRKLQWPLAWRMLECELLHNSYPKTIYWTRAL